MKHWLQAFRLRTLPLAFSCILLGSFLAKEKLDGSILLFTLLTTLFLQILSNLANDYGDYSKGVDNNQRVGPTRALQGGFITKTHMKRAIVIFSVLSLIFGISLLTLAFDITQPLFFVFLLLGVSAIVAAIKYTMGKNPYGYMGLGDVFVFVFFGLVGVVGTNFLHTHTFDVLILLPACTVGFLSVGVLNLNNLRDIKNDSESGKKTLVVKLGYAVGKKYHASLLTAATVCAFAYVILTNNLFEWQHYLFVLVLPIWIKQIMFVRKCETPSDLNPELKKLAMSTLLFVLLYGLPFIN